MSGSLSTIESDIEVTPVKLYEIEGNAGNRTYSNLKNDKDNMKEIRPLATLAIHFWFMDQRYGSPKMGNLVPPTYDTQPLSVQLDNNKPPVRKNTDSDRSEKSRHLTLKIRAVTGRT